MQIKNIVATLAGLGLLLPATSADCSDVEDSHSRCELFAELGFCENGNPDFPDRDAAFYLARCERTCGPCGGSPTSYPTPVPTPLPTFYQICEDKHPRCNIFLANGWCENGHPDNPNRDAEFYMSRCQKTCGAFYKTCIEAPETASPTFEPTIAPTTPACYDIHSNCALFLENGWCENGHPTDPDKDADFYKQRCQYTCGMCIPPTPAPSGPPVVPPTASPSFATSLPTLLPTLAPEPAPENPYWSCEDSHDNCLTFFDNGWCVTGNPNREAFDAEFYKEKCEYTCSACTSCYDNPAFACDENFCSEGGTAYNCPATCGTCPDYTGVTEPVACADRSVQCYVTQQYCETGLPSDPDVRDALYYQTRCPVTCGVCDPYLDFVGVSTTLDITELIGVDTYSMASGLPAMVFALSGGTLYAIGFDGETETTPFQHDVPATFVESMGNEFLAICGGDSCSFFNTITGAGAGYENTDGEILVDITFIDGEGGLPVSFVAATVNNLYTGIVYFSYNGGGDVGEMYFDDISGILDNSPDYSLYFAGNDIQSVATSDGVLFVGVDGFLLKRYTSCVMGDEVSRFVPVWSLLSDVSSMDFIDITTLVVISSGRGFVLSLNDAGSHVESVKITLDVGASAAIGGVQNEAPIVIGATPGLISFLAFQDPNSCRSLLSYATATAHAHCVVDGITLSDCPCYEMSDDSSERWMAVAAACGSCEGVEDDDLCAIAVAVCETDPSCRQCAASFDGCESTLDCPETTVCEAGETYFPTQCGYATCDYELACPELSCSASPTAYPTSYPTIYPSGVPTVHPSMFPTVNPTKYPTPEESVGGGSYGGSFSEST